MKAYGRKKQDCGCCPGHDTFPQEKYKNRRSVRAHSRDSKKMRRIARHRLHQSDRSMIYCENIRKAGS